MFDAQALAEKYVAVWNEADAERRRQQIAALWVSAGQRDVDVRKARIIESHNKNVRDSGCCFRAAKDAQTLQDIAIFHWEMLPAGKERITARGLEVVGVNAEGRILVDHQFIA